MKILHVEAGRNLYGGARQVLYLVKGLQERGVQNLVACPVGSEMVTRVGHAQIPVRPINMAGDLDFGVIGRLRVLIEQEQPDLIHLHSRRGADWLGGLAARRFSNIPVVLSRRVDNPESAFLAHFKYRLFDRVIVISNAIRTVLADAGVPGEKLRVVHSAVDTETWQHRWDHLAFLKTFFPNFSGYSKAGKDTPIIGVVAQLIERKGHRFVLNALPAIHDKFPNAKLIFFGQGREQAPLMRQAEELGLLDNVAFAGFRKDINQWLGCLDVFVHPATAEGLGVAVLQAAAASLPIVASDIGGLPEIIRDGDNGYLVTPGDVEEITSRVLQLLGDPELAGRMGEQARRTVEERFSVEAMVSGNLKVYQDLLSGKQRQW